MALMTSKDLQRILTSQDLQEVHDAIVGYLQEPFDSEKSAVVLEAVLASLDAVGLPVAITVWEEIVTFLPGLGRQPTTTINYLLTRRVRHSESQIRVDINGDVIRSG